MKGLMKGFDILSKEHPEWIENNVQYITDSIDKKTQNDRIKMFKQICPKCKNELGCHTITMNGRMHIYCP